MNVDPLGGVGVLSVDQAVLDFSGQQTGGPASGAFLSIGRSGGTGTATIANDSLVLLENMGSAGASVNLGGSGNGPGGNGSLTLSGHSHLGIEASFGRGVLTVGHDGSGLMRIKGNSSVDVANGGAVFIARKPGSDGLLWISEESTLRRPGSVSAVTRPAPVCHLRMAATAR